MKSLGRAALARQGAIRRSLLTLGGLALVAYGGWMIYRPAGVILAGLALLVVEGLSDGDGK